MRIGSKLALLGMWGVASGCSSSSPSAAAALADAGTGGTVDDAAQESGGDPTVLAGVCPSGFTPQEGKNTGFMSDDVGRVFHVLLPADTSTPRPVFVGLTGTVQEELLFAKQGEIDKLTEDGWIVLIPVRTCSQNGTNCSMAGTDGRVWEPWWDGTNPASDDPGPDVRFVESMVRCAATSWTIDPLRIYVGGISAGGSFTNHNMTYNSKFFAGGVDSSGDWYGGNVLPKTPTPMDPSIVIVIWGGPNDMWPIPNPIAVYAGETKLAANFYSAQSNVTTVSCTTSVGHIWPTQMTPWIAQTLLSHPKGTAKSDFQLPTPLDNYPCVVGPYTDH